MIAETAYNVIEALPEKEHKRLMVMLGVTKAESKPKQKDISKASIKEYLITKHKFRK